MFENFFSATPKKKDFDVLEAIDRVVEGTDPRLKLVRGYKKKLYDPVNSALLFIDELVANLPSVVELNKESFWRNSAIRNIFVSKDHMKEIFSQSSELRDLFSSGQGGDKDTCWALLSARREEKTVLGMELDGEIIKRDVMQEVVSFRGHRVVAASASEVALREEIKNRTFKQLIKHGLTHIASMRTNRKQLEDRQAMLQSKLRAAQKCCDDLHGMFKDKPQDPCEKHELHKELESVTDALRSATTDSATIEDYLHEIKNILDHPQEHIHLSCISLNIDRKGVKLNPKTGVMDKSLNLQEVQVGDGLRFVVLLVKCLNMEFISNDSFAVLDQRL